MRRPRTAILTILACVFIAFSLKAKDSDFDERVYYRDSVAVKKTGIPILVNRETLKVEYFWSYEDKAWIGADKSPFDLQKEYDEGIQLSDMQAELNRMHDETWDDRYRY